MTCFLGPRIKLPGHSVQAVAELPLVGSLAVATLDRWLLYRRMQAQLAKITVSLHEDNARIPEACAAIGYLRLITGYLESGGLVTARTQPVADTPKPAPQLTTHAPVFSA